MPDFRPLTAEEELTMCPYAFGDLYVDMCVCGSENLGALDTTGAITVCEDCGRQYRVQVLVKEAAGWPVKTTPGSTS